MGKQLGRAGTVLLYWVSCSLISFSSAADQDDLVIVSASVEAEQLLIQGNNLCKIENNPALRVSLVHGEQVRRLSVLGCKPGGQLHELVAKWPANIASATYELVVTDSFAEATDTQGSGRFSDEFSLDYLGLPGLVLDQPTVQDMDTPDLVLDQPAMQDLDLNLRSESDPANVPQIASEREVTSSRQVDPESGVGSQSLVERAVVDGKPVEKEATPVAPAVAGALVNESFIAGASADVSSADVPSIEESNAALAGNSVAGASSQDPESPLREQGLCFRFKNTPQADLTSNDFFDSCISAILAGGSTVRAVLKDGDDNIVYDASGPVLNVWTEDQLTATAFPYLQYHTYFHDQVVTLNNGDQLMITGKNSRSSGCAGSLGNGFGIMIYPSAPVYPQPKLVVLPFQQFIEPYLQEREFQNWSAGHEISYATGNAMDVCEQSLTGFAGVFEFYVM